MVDPDIDNRLRAIEAKVDENHRILVRMRRTQRNAGLVRVGYWVILILLSFGAWYYIQPYIGQLGAAYGLTHGDTNGTAQDGTQTTNINDLLDQLKNFQTKQ